jgi:hypothetical protein
MPPSIISGGAQQQQTYEKDNFKRLLDILRARASDLDSGEREAIIDCLKCDIKFC